MRLLSISNTSSQEVAFIASPKEQGARVMISLTLPPSLDSHTINVGRLLETRNVSIEDCHYHFRGIDPETGDRRTTELSDFHSDVITFKGFQRTSFCIIQ